MLGNLPFDFKSIEKITQAFGWIFSDITLQRINPSDNTIIKSIKVPIDQSAKEPWDIRRQQDPNAGDEANQKHVQIVLPRMAYELTNLRYDSSRKMSSINYRVNRSGNGPTALVQLNPVPFIFYFSLYLQTRTLSDSYAIIGQFIPFFKPDYVVPIMDIPEMNIKRDVVFTCVSNSHNDSYQGNFMDKRVIDWQFDFEGRGFLYMPIKEKKVITVSTTTVGDRSELVSVVPDTANVNDPFTIETTYT